MADPLLRIEGLRYRYPEAAADALAGIDLEVEAGEVVVVAGRSGSGKSSLLRACCGLVPHYHGGEVTGLVEVAGMDAREHGPAELGGSVGLVAQDPESQVVSTTVRAELELPLEIRGEPAAARARAVEEVALALAMPHLLERTTDSLSGGELQRVALAAALVLRPRLILLDEPTSQLDPVAGDELIWLLRRLNEEWGMAVLLAEHRLERCLAHADRVVALAAGRIAFDGAPEPYLEWALGADRALTTPAARLFDRAGLRPPPRSVKAARAALNLGDQTPSSPSPPVVSQPVRLTSGTALRARDLWVALDERDVLRGLDLDIVRGERVALMGRNGAGKTTLLRAAAQLVPALRGRVATPGGIALLPQNPGDVLLYERVGDELPGEEGAAALAAAGLGFARERDSRDLSGGERQRLALAVVAAGRGEKTPGLVCLDEPTRGMDQARKDELAAWIGELAAAGGAVVVATHDVELAAAFADRVVLLGDGRVIADGHPDEILSGGWYFATEVARILGVPGAITAEQGAAIIAARSDRRSEVRG